jgi:hypothetical protein
MAVVLTVDWLPVVAAADLVVVRSWLKVLIWPSLSDLASLRQPATISTIAATYINAILVFIADAKLWIIFDSTKLFQQFGLKSVYFFVTLASQKLLALGNAKKSELSFCISLVFS